MLFSAINTKFDRLVKIKEKQIKLNLYRQEKYQIEQEEQKKVVTITKIKRNGFRESLLDKIIKFGVMYGAVKVAQFVADKKNIGTVAGILKTAKGLFDVATAVGEFGAGNLMDGLSKVAGDKTILAKFSGGIQAAVGFISLRWLINPFKIISDIKSLPSLLGKVNRAAKFLSMSLSDLASWSKIFVKGLFKGIDQFFSRAILKVFGKPIWSYLRRLVNGLYKTVGGAVGGVIGKASAGVGQLASKFIPKAVIRAAGSFLTKIPIVGSLLGFGINLILGDPIQKAAFKLGTSTAGAALGGAVGLAFPPAIPFTAAIGGFLGDWLGDTLYDKFIPPKLALGGVVSHTSKKGTHVIVAENEDEVVIPLSMLTMNNDIGAKLFEPIKLVASNILGAIDSVIDKNDTIYGNISSDITNSLVTLTNTFGSATVVSKSITSPYIDTNNNEVNNSKSTNTNSDIFGTENINQVSQSDTLSTINNNTSVRGLLRSILDVMVNTDAIGGNFMNISPAGGITPPPAIVQSYSASADVPGTLIATGRATYYDPYDPTDKTSGGKKLSTGGYYSRTEFEGAVFPDLILRLPERYTARTNERPAYFRGKTIKKPFMVKLVHKKTGKQAYVKINDVGIGKKGDTSRLIDMNSTTKQYFGGDSGGIEVYLAPDDAKPGALPDLPKFEQGGEYVYNELPHKRWAGKRRAGRKHAGEDIAMRTDGTFQSFVGGKVMFKGFQAGKNKYGHYIDIYNDKLKVTERIAEAGQFFVKPGDLVKPGQIVSTGTSTGMIHYEIRPTPKYTIPQYYFAGTVDPVKYLQSVGALTIASNTIKNNGLQSLLDGTTLTANMDSSTVMATPGATASTANMDSSTVMATPGATTSTAATAPKPIPIDYSKIGKAFTDLTQMLGVNSTQQVAAQPKANNKSTTANKNLINNINLIRSGNSANVITVEQKIITPTKQPDARLRSL